MYVLNKYLQINNNITTHLSKYNTISIRYNVIGHIIMVNAIILWWYHIIGISQGITASTS